MKHYHKKRLLKLCDFLEQLQRKDFNFNVVAERRSCGTIACAVGWTPAVFPRLVKWSPNKRGNRINIVLAKRHGKSHYALVARSLFGLTSQDSLNLFTPWYDLYVGKTELGMLTESATPKQVAKRIRKFVRLTEQDN